MRTGKEAHNKIINSALFQMLLIIIAFALMGFFSFDFVSSIETRHLVKDSENSLSLAELRISSYAVESEDPLENNLDRVVNILSSINLTPNTYGMLLNKDLVIIAHPQKNLIGRNLRDISSGISSLAPELEKGININEMRVKNYAFDDSIVYFRKINYERWLGIIIPVREYNKNVADMAAFLIIIGSLLAAILCTLFYYIHRAKIKSDLRIQQKSNFLATMSHEIRTPLNAILGMTEIQMQNTSHRPSTSEAFIKINNSGNLLLNIINDILDLSKIETGKLELLPETYDVPNLINDVVQINYIRYQSKPIEFILEIDENIPMTLIGDILRIKQILNNILSNAFKYTDFGKVTFSVSAECVTRAGTVLVTLVFKITDTGKGMTAEQVNKLFDDYTRFNLEANRLTEGTGLGMTITRYLVELMYGTIQVKSEVNEGTTVIIRIPQKTESIGIRNVIGKDVVESLLQFRQGNSVQVKKAQFTHEYMPYGRILIVDDVETNLHVARGLMVPYGMDIDLAASGFEAIDKIKQGKKYDIIFMDHMMPKMDGIEATKQIRSMGYDQPIVALTANALVGQAELFLKNGFDDFIPKPIDIRYLNSILNKLIRDKQSPEVLDKARSEKEKMNKKTGSYKRDTNVDSQLAVIFTRDAQKAASVLKTCMYKNLNNDEDIHLYIINVHAMKSALANVGETELSAFAARLEQAGRDKNINVMLKETFEFLTKLETVIEKINPKKENEAGEDISENLSLLHDKLIIIKDSCLSYDKKTAKTALNELLEKTWSAGTIELLNTISEHLLHSEFDDIAELVEKHIKN